MSLSSLFRPIVRLFIKPENTGPLPQVRPAESQERKVPPRQSIIKSALESAPEASAPQLANDEIERRAFEIRARAPVTQAPEAAVTTTLHVQPNSNARARPARRRSRSSLFQIPGQLSPRLDLLIGLAGIGEAAFPA
jgi:hypothetical protein